MAQAEYQHQSPHTPAQLWGLFGAFTDLSWLPGPDKVTQGEHEGKQARIIHIGDAEPLVEYLIAKDDAAHSLRYGVLRNPFVPVDGYEAEVRITPAPNGATLSFKSQFTLDADADEPAIKQGLIGAYQLMAESADQRLASP